MDSDPEDSVPKGNTKEKDEADAESFYAFFASMSVDSKPVIYSSHYNITFLGLEKLHPFGALIFFTIVFNNEKKTVPNIQKSTTRLSVPRN